MKRSLNGQIALALTAKLLRQRGWELLGTSLVAPRWVAGRAVGGSWQVIAAASPSALLEQVETFGSAAAASAPDITSATRTSDSAPAVPTRKETQ